MITHLCNRCSEIRDYNIAEEFCGECLGLVRRQYEEMLKDEPTATTLSGWLYYNTWSGLYGIFGSELLATRIAATLAVISLPAIFLVLSLL